MANYVVIYVDMDEIAMFTQNEDLWMVFNALEYSEHSFSAGILCNDTIV